MLAFSVSSSKEIRNEIVVPGAASDGAGAGEHASAKDTAARRPSEEVRPRLGEKTLFAVAAFELSWNTPDPFRDETEIQYRINRPGHVRLRIYDLLGRYIKTIVDAPLLPGTYKVVFDGRMLASGVYLYRLEMPFGTEARKMTLLK